MKNQHTQEKHELRVTVLSENSTFKSGIGAEHGLSLSIEYHGTHVLFDTGASGLFLQNAGNIPVKLQDLKAVFISHGHYDHTGGLLQAMCLFDIPAYAHPGIFSERYSVRSKKARSIGLPFSTEELKSQGIIDRIVLNSDHETIEGFTLTGEIPRTCPFEEPNPHFFHDADGKRLDTVEDDQSLFVKTEHGLVVFLGCTHAGLVNTLTHILNISGEKRFHWIVGGTHLINATEERLRKTATALDEMEFDYISPLHCTGIKGQHFFHQHFGRQYRPLFCGETVRV